MLRALLHIAGAVRDDGRKVTPAMVEAARAEGATDLEIHDTVLQLSKIDSALSERPRHSSPTGCSTATTPAEQASFPEVDPGRPAWSLA